MAYIISPDEIKKGLPNYDPEHSEAVHSRSVRLADSQFGVAVKTRCEPTVILLAGGAASGKTEYISAYLNEIDAIIFDATLRTFDGAKIKIEKAQGANKKIEIHFIIPENIQIAFDAFLNRNRKYPAQYFYETHSYARKSVLQVAQILDISIKIYQSSYEMVNGERKMFFDEVDIVNKNNLLEFLTDHQYTEDEIKQIITDAI